MSFTPDDSIGEFFGYKLVIVQEEYNLSDFPVDILSIDKNLFETGIAQRMIFEDKRSGMVHNFTMDVDPGFKCVENFRGEVQWHMMECMDCISNFSFRLRNENGNLVSFNGQSITFRLSFKEIHFHPNSFFFIEGQGLQ